MKKNYPKKMFLVGLFIDLVRTGIIPILALILFALSFLLPGKILSLFPRVLLLCWPLYAVVNQLRVRHHIMNSDDECYQEMTDPAHADDWDERLRAQVQKKIDAQVGKTEETEKDEKED